MANTNRNNYTFQGFKWSRDTTLLLISLIAKNYIHLQSGVKKIIFQQIALEINEQLGTNLAFDQVESKWKGLKRTHKRVKESKTQLSWEFYDAVDAILKNDIEINPVITATSENTCVAGGEPEFDFVEYIVDSEDSTIRPSSKRCKKNDHRYPGENRNRREGNADRSGKQRQRRRSSDVGRSRWEARRRRSSEDSPSGYESKPLHGTRNSRESAEDARERRHQEKMKLARKFLAIFERMVDKI
ncbi:PREDICTED: uncharacterized protein LOC108367269 [Rhagoletis zephyria]|uniref:uncharacterized protein LOC108367269 n=1 Tax=Rhagoletis zephyria TaxID=28612 RepID=UPI0008114715|nr:PREDICTED: uncharacterized protein LOC108367269 [Rhagoletis zephyria]XP_017477348.1 PREDICTED: uncharacterized protein LOC108367269 [Rhagoletis zephyria]